MPKTITIHCRQVVAGKAEGEALVSKEGIAGYRSMDDKGYCARTGPLPAGENGA